MATDRETVRETATLTGDAPDSTGPSTLEPAIRRPMSRAVAAWGVVTAVLLVAWFFVAWLALGQNAVDAAGESVGMAFLLLVLVSVAGSVRGGRRR